VVGVLTAFGFFKIFVFFGVTLTVTRQFPAANATSLPPETLQIFLEAFDTVNATLAPAGIATPACEATEAAEVLLFAATRGVVTTGATTVTTEGAGPESAAGALFDGELFAGGEGGGVFTILAEISWLVDQFPARSITRTEKFEPLKLEAIEVA
jgi:hypothetical protein